jgi:C-terminal processing protease CtpA/Prc
MALKNKIIFKSNQAPNPTDLSVGEFIINVTDRKVFSKDRNNIVFEIQGAKGTGILLILI